MSSNTCKEDITWLMLGCRAAGVSYARFAKHRRRFAALAGGACPVGEPGCVGAEDGVAASLYL